MERKSPLFTWIGMFYLVYFTLMTVIGFLT
jgi:quinol-cytochrome oxidoreductase complex cytochrome b subunit